MKLIILLAVALTVAACATKPVAVTPTPVAMPVLPAPLANRAQPLPPITATDLHGLIREGVQTDRAYNDLAAIHNATVTAWECVRTALTSQTDPLNCFGDGQ